MGALFLFLFKLIFQSLVMGAWIQAFFTIYLAALPNSPFPIDNGNSNESTNSNDNDNGAVTDPECDVDADCDDGDECTMDACIDGLCFNDPIADCPAVEFFQITTEAQGSGRIESDAIGGFAAAGDVVTFTAVPTLCSTFDHWEGDLSGMQNPQMFVMVSDVDVVAVFEDVGSIGLSGEWDLTRTVNGTGGDAECLHPFRGVNDAPMADVFETGDTLAFTFSFADDADGNDLVDGSPGQLWFVDPARCDEIIPYEFNLSLISMDDGSVSGATVTNEPACGCDYVTSATFAGTFIDCNAISGTLDVTLTRTCDDLPVAQCSTMYTVGAVLATPAP